MGERRGGCLVRGEGGGVGSGEGLVSCSWVWFGQLAGSGGWLVQGGKGEGGGRESELDFSKPSVMGTRIFFAVFNFLSVKNNSKIDWT